MLNGTIIFIALILVVACSLLGWLSADTHPKRDGKALKKPPIPTRNKLDAVSTSLRRLLVNR